MNLVATALNELREVPIRRKNVAEESLLNEIEQKYSDIIDTVDREIIDYVVGLKRYRDLSIVAKRAVRYILSIRYMYFYEKDIEIQWNSVLKYIGLNKYHPIFSETVYRFMTGETPFSIWLEAIDKFIFSVDNIRSVSIDLKKQWMYNSGVPYDIIEEVLAWRKKKISG